MRVTLQRVLSAEVRVNGEVVASIGKGLLALVGIKRGDHKHASAAMVRKLLNMRLWDEVVAKSGAEGAAPPKEPRAWAASVKDIRGDVLLVSQFTLYAVMKGNKPDFHHAMPPEEAAPLYSQFVDLVRKEYPGGRVQNGVFGADMKVSLVNDGPVTISIDTDELDFSKELEKEQKANKYGKKQQAAPVAAAPPASSPSSSPPAASVSVSSPPVAVQDAPTNKANSKSTSKSATSASPGVLAAHSPLSVTSFSALVGNTPLLHLRHLSEASGCNIYAKAEFANPGGSIKDRAALSIIQAAEAAGQLVQGQPGWIVEGTAGNTGLGLTLVGASRGYRTLVVVPANNSQEKKDALRNLGATLVEIPQVGYSSPNNFVHVARRIYESMQKRFAGSDTRVILADQWSNKANRQAHFQGTGPEIWRQTRGKIDAFCCAVGTGGTLSGVSLFLKSKNPDVKCALIDPDGSAMKDWFENGQLRHEGSTIAEGIGQVRLCDNLISDGFKPDLCLHVSDAEALPIAYDLLQKEGLAIGLSSAVNVAGALKLARQLGPGHTIVTVLADSGTRYQSKMMNAPFLREAGLPVPQWIDADSDETKRVAQMGEELKSSALLSPEEIERIGNVEIEMPSKGTANGTANGTAEGEAAS